MLCFLLQLTNAKTSFEAVFQNSNIWSAQEWLEYQGNIPELKEFTACHWEKLQYFALRSNTIWAYCAVRSKAKKKLSCIQL